MLNCFLRFVNQRKGFTPYFQPGPLSDNLTIANLRHTRSRVSTCAESESTGLLVFWSTSVSPYTVRMRENTDHKNSEYGHFSSSVIFFKVLRVAWDIPPFSAANLGVSQPFGISLAIQSLSWGIGFRPKLREICVLHVRKHPHKNTLKNGQVTSQTHCLEFRERPDTGKFRMTIIKH